LDNPAVDGVIVGVLLGVTDHREETGQVFELRLQEDDLGALERVLVKGRDLFSLIGDCGDEYR
jgi:hypothetical protein